VAFIVMAPRRVNAVFPSETSLRLGPGFISERRAQAYQSPISTPAPQRGWSLLGGGGGGSDPSTGPGPWSISTGDGVSSKRHILYTPATLRHSPITPKFRDPVHDICPLLCT